MQESTFTARLIACTQLCAPSGAQPSTAKDSSSDALVELAGRVTFGTQDRARESTSETYLRHLLELDDARLLEHASASIMLTGISQACAQDILSFRSLSCAVAPAADNRVVVPGAIAKDPQLADLFARLLGDAAFVFKEVRSSVGDNDRDEANRLVRQQEATRAARSVLPAAMETEVLATGTLRAWREVISTAAAGYQNAELREVALECLRLLRTQAPVVFSDLSLPDLGEF